MRTLLIDADTLIFEAATVTEAEVQWEPWLWTVHGDFDAAMEHLDRSLDTIQRELEADRMILALSDNTRWRNDVMPTYKSNRAKTRKPVTYKPLRQYCHEKYEVFQRPTLEGDDVLGILATHPHIVQGQRIIVSIDKDMRTIPGLHLNYRAAAEAGLYVTEAVSEQTADYNHLYQTLTGDSTDGYPGCPGVGPVKAKAILDKALGDGTPWADSATFVRLGWAAVVAAYKKAGLSELEALTNARVARICRHTDYAFATKRVIYWNPPEEAA